MQLYLATRNGFVRVEGKNGRFEPTLRSLDGHYCTSIIAREGVILLGTREGVWRSDDLGETWREAGDGLPQPHVRWLAYHPTVSDFELAGTEPAALAISRDGGASWQEAPEVTALREQFKWWLPYSPEAGCVRGFAAHGERLYAAVEVGGLLRSDDRGRSWRLAAGSDGRPQFGQPKEGFIHPDVHSVAVHATSAERVFAPTGGGFYVSDDGGDRWTAVYDDCYVRAVWIDPGDIDHLLLGPAEGPSGRDGRIEESHDGGRSWQVVSERWMDDLVERFVQAKDVVLAMTQNGRLLRAPEWEPVLAEVGGITAVTVMGDDGPG
jgi:photosystem II stability/assembly factor-like uncharacterized protein